MTPSLVRCVAALAVLFAPPVLASPIAAQLAPSRQLMIVDSDGWDAPRGQLQRYERQSLGPNSRFHTVGPPLGVWLGRSGLGWRSDPDAPPPPSPGPRKQEGDGRSPAGLLGLGELFGYAAQPPPQVRLPYQQSDSRWRCVDDPDSTDYNQLRRAPPIGAAPWRSAELLLLPTDHYKYLIVLDYNRQPQPRPRAGSCIFLHVAPPPGGPTAGCTALAEADLLTLLRWLDPTQRPLLLQLPRPARAAAMAAWELPAELPR
jgi:hypothetical protein